MRFSCHSVVVRSLALVLVLAGICAMQAGRAGEAEVGLSDEQYKSLDRFEAFALRKADKVFGEAQKNVSVRGRSAIADIRNASDEKNEYKLAAAEYEAFAVDNPRSKVLSYALVRKARC